MSLFIAISSCQRYEDNGWNDALRETWLQDAKALGIEYKFFMGAGATSKEDVVLLNSGDDYVSLPYKTLEKFRWVYAAGFYTLFHCYHDTYACPERLLKWAGAADYFGDYYHADPRQPYPHYSYGVSCQSGQGVFISRRALGVVVEEFGALLKARPDVWEEDAWTGKIISKHPELSIRDTRNMPCNLTPEDRGPRIGNDIISVHLSTIVPPNYVPNGRESEARYRPEYMHKLHKEWKECEEPIAAAPLISYTPATSASSSGSGRTSITSPSRLIRMRT